MRTRVRIHDLGFILAAAIILTIAELTVGLVNLVPYMLVLLMVAYYAGRWVGAREVKDPGAEVSKEIS
jgi:hypothetical protein